MPTTSVRRRISLFSRSCGLLDQIWRQWGCGNEVNAKMSGPASAVRSDLRQTARTLAATQSEMQATEVHLENTTTKLDLTDARLDQTASQRDDLQQRVEEMRIDLKGLKGSLDEAQNTVQLQTGQIAVLKTCLDGVTEATSDILYGYYSAAINALTWVEDACNEAYSLF